MNAFTNYGQLVIGPAGSGKSTYCKIIQEHAATLKRNIRVVNLDPAAESFHYKCDLDIRELINVSKVMDKYKYGPNGALVYCMDYLYKHINWLEDKLLEFGENNYFLFDCPGQFELFSHYPVLKKTIKHIQNLGINLCSIFCLDATFLSDYSKYLSGSLLALSSMIQIELPHINVMTKCDLIKDKDFLEKIEEMDPKHVLAELEDKFIGKNMERLNKSLVELIDNFSLVDFLCLDLTDEDSINAVLYAVDNAIQYHENQEPRDELYNVEDDDQQMEINNAEAGFM